MYLITEINMNIGPEGVTISPDEIVDMLQRISSRINKNKNYICLSLYLINKNIGQWNSEVNLFIFDQMAKNLTHKGEKIPEEDISKIFGATLDSPRKNAATQSMFLLSSIEKKFNFDNLEGGNKKLDVIRFFGGGNKKLDVEKIKEIQCLIAGESQERDNCDCNWIKSNSSNPEEEQMLRKGFIELVKDDYYLHVFKNLLSFGGEPSAQILKNWYLSLEKLKNRIMELVYDIQDSLDCQQDITEILKEVNSKETTT